MVYVSFENNTKPASPVLWGQSPRAFGRVAAGLTAIGGAATRCRGENAKSIGRLSNRCSQLRLVRSASLVLLTQAQVEVWCLQSATRMESYRQFLYRRLSL